MCLSMGFDEGDNSLSIIQVQGFACLPEASSTYSTCDHTIGHIPLTHTFQFASTDAEKEKRKILSIVSIVDLKNIHVYFIIIMFKVQIATMG